nr:hypothetical protein [uncultured Brumimicrobium sp.]
MFLVVLISMAYSVFIYDVLRVSATNLVDNYRPRKSARTFASRQEAINEL